MLKKGDKVAVVGLGGLGHMAVKIAAAMGAEVYHAQPLSRKSKGCRLSRRTSFRADHRSRKYENDLKGSYNLIIDTVSASHDYCGLFEIY